MALGDIIKATVQIERKLFYKVDNNFGIVSASIVKLEEGEPVLNEYGTLTIKGTMPEPKPGGRYFLNAKEVTSPKFGLQYQVNNMCTSITLDPKDTEGQRIYLETIFTEKQVESMYDALDNPYQAFLEDDVTELLTVKGIGPAMAPKLMAKFKQNLDKSRIYVELIEFDLTAGMVNRLHEHYSSADIAIAKVKENPYRLMEVKGIGWKRCDELALQNGMGIYSAERVEAYIMYYLEEMAEKGYTYVYSNSQLMDSIVGALGEEIPDEPIGFAIKHLGDKLWWSEDKECIGLSKYINIERNIAKRLIELRDAPNEFNYSNWENVVKCKETEQGWEYTDQQKRAIKETLENNVILITGLAGTGKSTVVDAILEVLRKYTFAQCALAGKAASRMAEITSEEGYTIHRLLGFPKGKPETGMFQYHCENTLPFNMIIVDEISMVDGRLFLNLINALEPGTKLIMLGDVGQLESIGCANIANDLIHSEEIQSVELDKIHRQAAASAIITDSIGIRQGAQPVEKDWVGTITKGELQDLTYDCYSDAGNTFYKVMEYTSTLLNQQIDIMDLQVIVPIKERDAGTWNLNLAIQEIYNPLKTDDDELIIAYDRSHVGSIRVGDKVINVKNNYKTKSYVGQWDIPDREEADKAGETIPIYNGTMGVVTAINRSRYEMIVRFEGIGEILVGREMLTSIMLGYAITTHKSQGSEAKYIIFGCDFSAYSLLTKELIYTAITRAKKHCYVIAQTSALRFAVGQNGVSNKQTVLRAALSEIAHPKLAF